RTTPGASGTAAPRRRRRRSSRRRRAARFPRSRPEREPEREEPRPALDPMLAEPEDSLENLAELFGVEDRLGEGSPASHDARGSVSCPGALDHRALEDLDLLD